MRNRLLLRPNNQHECEPLYTYINRKRRKTKTPATSLYAPMVDPTLLDHNNILESHHLAYVALLEVLHY